MEARNMAEAHWIWLESLLHKVYVDGFIHGVKHGRDPDKEPDTFNIENEYTNGTWEMPERR